MDTQLFIAAFQHDLDHYRHKEKAAAMKKYMVHQFSFLGIQAPEQRKLSSQFINGSVN